MSFIKKIDNAIEKNSSILCVGLDSDFENLPEKFRSSKNPQFEFNKFIIEQTNDLVSSYKINSAFYEARGVDGITDLKKTFDYLRETYPDVPTILDAKRADIGNTNNGYVKFAFDFLGADSITLHPYLGQEAIKPFLDYENKGIFILCKTSNPGAGEIQDLKVNGENLYLKIAKLVSNVWNKNKNCMLVVGATYPDEMRNIRNVAPDMTFLVPGIGAQGGDLEQTLKAGLLSDKKGLIIHSARAIIFADNPRFEAEKLKEQINKYR